MKKILLSIALFASTTLISLSAQGLCDAANTVANSASNGFESLRGKYTSTDYTGQWEATTKLPGAKSCIIDENSGMYIATMATGVSREQAFALVSKWEKEMGCMSGWNNWKYDNEGESFYQTFYSEKADNLGADGGNYGGWGAGYTPKWNKNKRDYNSYDKVAMGKTVQFDVRKIDGSGKWEVRILIYDAK
ncbi:MAG: hypothetical protein HYZ42_07560 [Bacteroidetes bacterium]|nr:hypothetical protein [Bacteroidota bacterium]